MKHHGIGVGYRYPHEFEGADVEQQYLPDELADRRYYLPDRPGLRADDRRAHGAPARRRARRLAQRRQARAETRARTEGRRDGRRREDPKNREESRKKLAETKKRDATTD